MKVLYDHQVFSYQESGGVSRYFSELIKGLSKFGWNTELAVKYTHNKYLLNGFGQKYENWLPKFSFKGKTHIVNNLNKGLSKKLLKTRNFDLFHPTYYDPYFIDKLKGKPFVLTIHDMIHELFPNSVSDADIVCERKKILAHLAKKVIAVSENTKKDAVKLLGISPDKVEVIYHGNSFNPESIKPRYDHLPDLYLLYVGNRTTYKNIKTVFEAFSSLDPAKRNLWLILAGGGPLTKEEYLQLDRLKIRDNTIQVNPDDGALAGLYDKAVALVYPSLYEGFGLPLIEAMSFGCPLIAANSSCLPEVGGAHGFYFEPEDDHALSQMMKNILDNPDTRQTIGLKVKNWARSFTWDRTLDKTAQVYGMCI